MAEGPWLKYQRSAPAAPATGPGGFPREGRERKSGPWEKYAGKDGAQGSGPMGFLNRPIMSVVEGMSDIARAPARLFANEAAQESLDYGPTAGARDIGVEVAGPDEVADTYAERAAEGVGLAATTLVPGGVGVGLAARAPGVVGGAARTVAEPFLRSPALATGTEAAMGAAAGAGGLAGERVAQEAGVDPFWGRLAGEFLGGGAPIAGAVAARGAAQGGMAVAEKTPVAGQVIRWGRSAFLPFTEGGAREIAGRRMRGLAGGDEKAAELAGKVGTGETISGRTLAEQTESPGLIALEREVLKADPDAWESYSEGTKQATQKLREYIEAPVSGAEPQDAQQYIAAQRAYTKGLIELRVQQAADEARARVEKLRPELKETEASKIYRRELDAALRDVQAQERELWGAVPDDVTVPTRSAKDAFVRLREGLGRAQEDDLPDEAVRFLDPDRNSAFGDAESAKEMHALYSKLRETARNARGGDNPNRNKARIADDLAEAVLADLQAMDDVGGPLGAALSFTRQRHQTFSQGTVGDLLGLKARGGEAVAPEVTLDRAIGRGGAKSAVAADELRAATEGRPDAEAAMRDYMRRRFTEFTSPRGEFNADKAQDFLRQNNELLDRFPDLKREITEAAETGQFAQAARKEVDQGLKEAETAPDARFADAAYGKEFEAVLSEKNPAQAARAIRQRAGTDPTGQAARGLESAAYDYVIRKSLGDQGFSGAKMRALLSDKRTRAALKETIGNEGIARLGRVLREVEMMERAGGKLPGVGGDIITEGPLSALKFALGTVGARLGSQLGAGTSGASLRTAQKGAGALERMLDNLTYASAARMVRDALEDPELFKSLLLNTRAPGNEKRISRAIAPYLAAQTGQAAEEVGGREPAPPPGPWQNYAPLGPRSEVDEADRAIASEGSAQPVPPKAASVVSKAVSDNDSLNPIKLARAFVGADERKDAGVIGAFIRKMTGQKIDPRETPWCAAFVNAVLKGSGIEGTGKLNARSFLSFGQSTNEPEKGDIAVFWRDDPESAKGHVGFYAGEVKRNGQTFVRVVGGNQNDSVSEKLYPKSRLLGYRRPPKVKAD